MACCDAALPAGLRQVVHARCLLRLRHTKAHSVNHAVVVEFALLSCLRFRVMCFFEWSLTLPSVSLIAVVLSAAPPHALNNDCGVHGHWKRLIAAWLLLFLGPSPPTRLPQAASGFFFSFASLPH